MYDVCIRIIELPLTVKGATVADNDGVFSVYVNSKLPFEEQRAACEHELRHIACQHFDKGASLSVLENEADDILTRIKVSGEYNRILVK